MAVRKNPIAEAKRYMENARCILSEKGEKKDGYYQFLSPIFPYMLKTCNRLFFTIDF